MQTSYGHSQYQNTINRTLWKKQDIIGSAAKNGDYT